MKKREVVIVNKQEKGSKNKYKTTTTTGTSEQKPIYRDPRDRTR
jgi:hypothetical protein